MRLKEFFNPIRSISNLGAFRFGLGTFKKEEKTPHYEMREAIEAFQKRPMINSGVNQLASFIIGKRIIIKSQDQKTQNFLNDWLQKRPRFKKEIYNFVVSTIVTGNGYLEVAYKKAVNGIMYIDNIFAIPDSSRVYKNLDSDDDQNFWIYEIPPEVRSYRIGNEEGYQNAAYWKLNYVKGSALFRNQVYGIPVHKSKIAHLPIGWSQDNIYGRSFLASTLDDVNIIEEITKNWAMISRYRALNTKIISIGDEKNPGDIRDINYLEEQFKSRREEEHIMINKPYKIDSLSNVGEYDSMESPMDFLRKDVGSGLVPNFITPWNSEVNRATAGEAKIPFQLYIQSRSEELIDFLNILIISSLRKKYLWISPDATFDFEGVDLKSTEEKMGYARDMYQANVITFNEYRKAAEYDPVKGGDVFAKDIKIPEDSVNHLLNYDNQNTIMEGAHSNIKTHSLSITPLKAPSVHTEKIATESDKNFLKKTGLRKVTILKKNNVGGKILRQIKNGDESITIYLGKKVLSNFDKNMRQAADAFYDNTKTNLIKLQDEFFKDKTPENEVTDNFFNQILDAHLSVIDDLFNDIKVKGKRKTSEGFLSIKIFKNLEDRFKDFDKKIKGLMPDLSKSVLKILVNPSDPNEVAPDDKLKDKLKTRVDLLIKQKTFDQIKTFNGKAKQDIKRIMSDGIAAGKTSAQIKQDIKDKYMNWKTKKNPQESNISRIVRTEISNNISLMKLYKWKQQGFEKFLWQTSEDDKVRDVHKKRNQRVFNIDDALKGNIIFPGGSIGSNAPDSPNINCRCTAILWE